jgi:hypothetical protein
VRRALGGEAHARLVLKTTNRMMERWLRLASLLLFFPQFCFVPFLPDFLGTTKKRGKA